MFDFFRRMFSAPKLSEESSAFITTLAASDIWLLAVGLRGTPQVPSIAGPEAIALIAAHRIDVSDLGDDDSIFPFNYARNGRQALPFFSSEERARRFASDNKFPIDVTIFQPYRLLVGFVATRENETFDLVFDPGSPAERTLTGGERHLLRSLSASR